MITTKEKKMPEPEKKADDWKSKTAELRKTHQSTFEAFLVPDALFHPKSHHPKRGEKGGENYMSFFSWEFKHACEKKAEYIYTESVDNTCVPELPPDGNPLRTLYRFKVRPDWESAYKPTEDGKRLLVPVSELSVVTRGVISSPDTKPGEQVKLKFEEIMDPEVDMPLDQLTVRDKMAIDHWVPCSTKKWINEIIEKYPEGCH